MVREEENPPNTVESSAKSKMEWKTSSGIAVLGDYRLIER